MAKQKTIHTCNGCGGSTPQWVGKCPHCGEWNTLVETVCAEAGGGSKRVAGWTGKSGAIVDLSSVKGKGYQRESTGSAELDRVLGGGLVPGSVTLLGGDPGIGKSTLLLQTLARLGERMPVLYVTGEESPEQVALRGERLGLASAPVRLLAEIEMERIQSVLTRERPAVAVIDSVQTVYSSILQSAPGTVAQVRECAAQLTRLAKSMGTSLILVGHVTKEGSLAGPRVLEHMVDTVLYFEGEAGSQFRMVRAFKNRFGSANELGVFSMGAMGLEEVSNPSSMFMTAHEKPVPGCAILAATEGNRPFLVEVQALVEDAPTPNPKRFASGIDTNRLQMLLAVLNRHAGVTAFDQNVYVKVVGGIRLMEPAADLAVLLAVHSSMTGRPLPEGLCVFGEVGLAGEIRPVQSAGNRLREAAKLGFTTVMAPKGCPADEPGIQVQAVARVDEAMACLRSLKLAA